MPPTGTEISEGNADGWNLSTTIRIASDEALAFDASPFVSYRDGNTGWQMNFGLSAAGDTQVRLFTGATTGPVHTLAGNSTYNTFSLIYDPVLSNADFFVNGTEVFSDYGGFATTQTSVLWGAGRSPDSGQGNFSAVSFSTGAVPEPSPLAAIALLAATATIGGYRSHRRIVTQLRMLPCDGYELVFRVFRQHQSPEVNFLWDLVRVELQSDWSGAAEFWLWVCPVGDQLSIDDVTDAIANRKNLHPVPAMLNTSAAGDSFVVFVDTVASVEVVETVIGGIHHQVTGIAVRIALALDGLAPESDSRVHFALHKFRLEDQAEVAVFTVAHEVRAGLRSIRHVVPRDDDSIANAEVLFRLGSPARQVFAVKQVDWLFASGQLRNLAFAPAVQPGVAFHPTLAEFRPLCGRVGCFSQAKPVSA